MAQQFVASMSDQNNFPFQNLSSDKFEAINSANMFSQCDMDRLSKMKFNPFRLNKFKSESCHYATEFLEQLLLTSKFLPLIIIIIIITYLQRMKQFSIKILLSTCVPSTKSKNIYIKYL